MTDSRALRKRVPASVRRPLGRLRTVGRRLQSWLRVASRCKGASPADRRVLLRAVARAPITVWQDLDRWQMPMLDQDCTVVSRDVGSFRVRGCSDDLGHVLSGQEPAVETLIRHRLRPGDTFIDAGSNVGFYTILAAKLVGPRGRVIACEMVPATADVLRGQVALNGYRNIEVVEGALAPVADETITASLRQGRFGVASITRSSGDETVSVKTVTLETILHSLDQVRLMKMDLEGAELGALQGAGLDLSKVESIVFEDRDVSEASSFLISRGFRVRRLDACNKIAERN